MKTQCPHCKSKFNVKEANIGKQAKCPKCTKPFTIQQYAETSQPAKPMTSPPKPQPSAGKASLQTETFGQAAAVPVKRPEPVSAPARTETKEEIQQKSAEAAAVPAKISEPPKKEKPKSKKLSKIVFLYCWIAVRIIAVILGFLGISMLITQKSFTTIITVLAAADVFWLAGVFIELLLFYKIWAAIQDGRASMSPCKAVAFLFIPVFNFYWALLMFLGIVDDYNAFIQRRSVKTGELSFTLFLIYAFLFILSEMFVTVLMLCILIFVKLVSRALDSYSGLVWTMFVFMAAAAILHFIMHILIADKTCNAVNALEE